MMFGGKVVTKGIHHVLTHNNNSCYVGKNRLEGKVAIITGSSYGIGYSIAERIGLEGAKVVICSRNQNNVDNAVSKLKEHNIQVVGVQCHVAKPEDRAKLYKETLDKFGEINILISNVAANPSIGNILDCEESKWDKIFDVNLKSSFLLAKETVPYIRKNKGGKILFISSAAGYVLSPPIGAYSVSKTALIALSKAIAIQLAHEDIQVNCIAPGLIRTSFADIFFNSDSDYKDAPMPNIPMKRPGEPCEVAGVAAFLVSDDASYITGETIVVAGGHTSRL